MKTFRVIALWLLLAVCIVGGLMYQDIIPSEQIAKMPRWLNAIFVGSFAVFVIAYIGLYFYDYNQRRYRCKDANARVQTKNND
jgi:hypothetical protein